MPKRSADVISNAGEKPAKNQAAVELGRRGGVARAKTVSPERRVEIAKKAASARWKLEP
jgi:hypothetical protein